MKLVSHREGAAYAALTGLVDFYEYPATLPEESQAAATSASKTPTAPKDASLVGVFVGQLPLALPPGYLAWLVNLLLGVPCVTEASMARNQCCGRVVIPRAHLSTALNLSETSLCDSSGVWIARSPSQVQLLRTFCEQLSTGGQGIELLALPLPKKCLVLKVQQSMAGNNRGVGRGGSGHPNHPTPHPMHQQPHHHTFHHLAPPPPTFDMLLPAAAAATSQTAQLTAPSHHQLPHPMQPHPSHQQSSPQQQLWATTAGGSVMPFAVDLMSQPHQQQPQHASYGTPMMLQQHQQWSNPTGVPTQQYQPQQQQLHPQQHQQQYGGMQPPQPPPQFQQQLRPTSAYSAAVPMQHQGGGHPPQQPLQQQQHQSLLRPFSSSVAPPSHQPQPHQMMHAVGYYGGQSAVPPQQTAFAGTTVWYPHAQPLAPTPSAPQPMVGYLGGSSGVLGLGPTA